MKTFFLSTIISVVLILPVFSQTNPAVTNIRRKIAETPPLPEIVVRPHREGLSTNPPVVRLNVTNFGFRVVSRNPIHILLTRPQALVEADDRIIKYHHDPMMIARKAEMVRKFDEALIEAVQQSVTNDYTRKRYRQCVAFWTTNHIEGRRIVPGAPPTNQVYFCPEVR